MRINDISKKLKRVRNMSTTQNTASGSTVGQIICPLCSTAKDRVDIAFVQIPKHNFVWQACWDCLYVELTREKNPLISDPKTGDKIREAVKALLYDLGLYGLSAKQKAIVDSWIKDNS